MLTKQTVAFERGATDDQLVREYTLGSPDNQNLDDKSHPEATKIKCKVCDFESKSEPGLKIHMRAKHDDKLSSEIVKSSPSDKVGKSLENLVTEKFAGKTCN